jgi:hypothetical protein
MPVEILCSIGASLDVALVFRSFAKKLWKIPARAAIIMAPPGFSACRTAEIVVSQSFPKPGWSVQAPQVN